MKGTVKVKKAIDKNEDMEHSWILFPNAFFMLLSAEAEPQTQLVALQT